MKNIKSIIDWIKRFWREVYNRVDPVEAYLSQAVDIHDLEQRMKRIEKGHAPFQRHYRPYDVYDIGCC